MKFLLILILGAAGVAWFYPQYIEGTENGCTAFEKKLGVLVQDETKKLPPAITSDPRTASLLSLFNAALGAANGMLAEGYIKDKFPQLPPSVGCVAAYWKITFDPDLQQYVKGRIPGLR
jgi:hypothetical protein